MTTVLEDRFVKLIAEEVGCRPQQVMAAANLFAEKATVPFVARYRKEVTGGLIDEQLETWRGRIGRYDRVRHRLSNIQLLGSINSGSYLCRAYVDVDARILGSPHTMWSAAARYEFEVVESEVGYVFNAISVALDWTDTQQHQLNTGSTD